MTNKVSYPHKTFIAVLNIYF